MALTGYFHQTVSVGVFHNRVEERSGQCLCGFEWAHACIDYPRSGEPTCTSIVQIGMDSGFSGVACGKPA